jgi:hypothetical protein
MAALPLIGIPYVICFQGISGVIITAHFNSDVVMKMIIFNLDCHNFHSYAGYFPCHDFWELYLPLSNVRKIFIEKYAPVYRLLF